MDLHLSGGMIPCSPLPPIATSIAVAVSSKCLGLEGRADQGGLNRKSYHCFCKIWPLMKSLCSVTWNAIKLTPFSTPNLLNWYPSPGSRRCWGALVFYMAIGKPSEDWSKLAFTECLCWMAWWWWGGGGWSQWRVSRKYKKVSSWGGYGRIVQLYTSKGHRIWCYIGV